MAVYMEGEDGPCSRQYGTLAQLWPFASPYTQLDRAGQLAAGKALRDKTLGDLRALDGDEALVYHSAVAACRADCRQDVHPVSYGAAVVFENGAVAAASGESHGVWLFTRRHVPTSTCNLKLSVATQDVVHGRSPGRPTRHSLQLAPS